MCNRLTSINPFSGFYKYQITNQVTNVNKFNLTNGMLGNWLKWNWNVLLHLVCLFNYNNYDVITNRAINCCFQRLATKTVPPTNPFLSVSPQINAFMQISLNIDRANKTLLQRCYESPSGIRNSTLENAQSINLGMTRADARHTPKL